ncbi:c-type cytochrome [Aestuariibius sp. HNIBRBA575]|uniref:c-type cytochrome n=1 Tax=Aestuariibius sp. HNIBRBA575 TaxID=3233343 RepID=UPI0034A5382F
MKTVSILLGCIALAGCVQNLDDPSPESGAIAFREDCASCHGLDAMGSGSFGGALIITPPDLTRLSERHGGMYPAGYVMNVIDGYARGDHFSAAMPEFGAGDMGPTINVEQDGVGTPIPARLLALSLYLESIQR